MSEPAAEDTGGDACGQRQRGVGMAEIVQPHGWEPCRANQSLEPTAHVFGVQGLAIGVRKDQPVVVEVSTYQQTQLQLMLVVNSKRLNGDPVECNRTPALSCLGLSDRRAMRDGQDGLTNGRPATFYVKVAPPQTQSLSTADTGERHEPPERCETIVLCRSHECLQLFT
jgi:hypothetical protein